MLLFPRAVRQVRKDIVQSFPTPQSLRSLRGLTCPANPTGVAALHSNQLESGKNHKFNINDSVCRTILPFFGFAKIIRPADV